MPIVTDGVTMRACNGVIADNKSMETVNADGTKVFTEVCFGEFIYYEDDIFHPPAGLTQVNVCMIGGGGSGSICEDIDNFTAAGGGYSGNILSQSITIEDDIQVEIVCGLGGAARSGVGNGNAGNQSSFGSHIASGGAGGIHVNPGTTSNYAGEGAERDTCFGINYDGNMYSGAGSFYYGGQAGFANGGDAIGVVGTDGAGGGAGYQTGISGAGGRGVVKVFWP